MIFPVIYFHLDSFTIYVDLFTITRISRNIGFSWNSGTPIARWFIMNIPTNEMDDDRGTRFRNASNTTYKNGDDSGMVYGNV